MKIIKRSEEVLVVLPGCTGMLQIYSCESLVAEQRRHRVSAKLCSFCVSAISRLCCFPKAPLSQVGASSFDSILPPFDLDVSCQLLIFLFLSLIYTLPPVL